MRKICVACITLLGLTCAAAIVVSQTHRTPPANSCHLVDVLPDISECHPTAGGMECSMGDMAPSSWGLCLEDKKKEFTCLNKHVISHYKGGPFAVWSMPASKCPALAEQLRQTGQDQKALPVPVPQETPVPATKTNKT